MEVNMAPERVARMANKANMDFIDKLTPEERMAILAHNNLLMAEENVKRARWITIGALVNAAFAILNFIMAANNVLTLGRHH